MQALSFLILAVLPPLISGPLPAIIMVRMASGRNWRWLLPISVLWAIVLNLAAAVAMVTNLDGLLPPGFLACLLTPMAALATLIVSLRFRRRSNPGPDADPVQRRWLHVGLVAVPVLQILTLVILVLLAPSLCNTPLRHCADS